MENKNILLKKIAIISSFLVVSGLVVVLIFNLAGNVNRFSSSPGIKTSIISPKDEDKIFSLSLQNEYTITVGEKLSIPIDVNGATTATGRGISGAQINIKNIPSFLTNPKLKVSNSSWENAVNSSNLSDGKISFQINDAPTITSSQTNFFILTFDVTDNQTGSLNLDITLVSNEWPPSSHKIDAGVINFLSNNNESFSVYAPDKIEITSDQTSVVIPVGVYGATSVIGNKVSGFSFDFKQMPSYFSSCSPSANLSNWTVSSGKLANNFIRVTGVGSGNPLIANNQKVFNLTCQISGTITDSEIEISGEISTDQAITHDVLKKKVKINLTSTTVTPTPTSAPTSAPTSTPTKTPTPASTSDNDDCDASIGNLIWYDNNGNGVQDSGELGISGVEVKVFNGNKEWSDKTNSSGKYEIDDLCEGSYLVKIRKDDVAGLIQTYDRDGDLDDKTEVDLEEGEDYSKADFGYKGGTALKTGPGFNIGLIVALSLAVTAGLVALLLKFKKI